MVDASPVVGDITAIRCVIPAKAGIEYVATLVVFVTRRDYWMPAGAGMTESSVSNGVSSGCRA